MMNAKGQGEMGLQENQKKVTSLESPADKDTRDKQLKVQDFNLFSNFTKKVIILSK